MKVYTQYSTFHDAIMRVSYSPLTRLDQGFELKTFSSTAGESTYDLSIRCLINAEFSGWSTGLYSAGSAVWQSTHAWSVCVCGGGGTMSPFSASSLSTSCLVEIISQSGPSLRDDHPSSPGSDLLPRVAVSLDRRPQLRCFTVLLILFRPSVMWVQQDRARDETCWATITVRTFRSWYSVFLWGYLWSRRCLYLSIIMILSQERKINEGGRYRQIERSRRQEWNSGADSNF